MSVSELLAKAAEKRVLFCGEKIVDVYHYVKPLGRPTKDAIVSVEIDKTEEFAGGIYAAVEHVKNMVRMLDTHISGQAWRKTRFVDSAHFHKLFQTYTQDKPISMRLPKLDEYDAVVVLDYGHGMANSDFLARVQEARYLAVNVQTNSGNYGYNLATKYQKADYLCVDEPEARLATQNRDGDIRDSLFVLGRIAAKVVVTLGKKGAIGLDERGYVHTQVAYTDKVVDTMGAGDAFFALTAIVAQDATIQEILQIGCAAGAIKAGIVGHRKAVTRDGLLNLLASVPQQAGSDALSSTGGSGIHLIKVGPDGSDLPYREWRVGCRSGPYRE